MKFKLLFIVVLTGMLFVPNVFAEEISSFDTTLTIQPSGLLQAVEKITYDFGDKIRHGILRNIPYTKTNTEGKKYEMDIVNISVLDQNGKTYTYTVASENDEKKIKTGDVDKTLTGQHEYQIAYDVSGALTYFSDHDELYWNITGNQWDYPIQKVSASIILPQHIPEGSVKASCFSGAIHSVETSCTAQVDKNIVSIVSTKSLLPNEGVTVVVGFPKNIVAVLEPRLYVSFWDTFTGKITLVALAILAALWYVVLPVSIPILWWRHGRDPKPAIGVASAWFSAPKTKDGNALTPGETGTLVDEKADMQDITATIVHLAQRGYIKIIESEKNIFSLKKISPMPKDEPLCSHESRLYSDIFGALDIVNLKTAKLSNVVEKAKTDLYEEVVADGFFDKNPQSVRTKYIVLAVLGFCTGNFGLLLSSLLFGLQMPRKTVLGSQQAAIARSLKNFLTSQERQLSFQAKNQMMFEKLLPFAIAFGVEKIWAKRFSDIHMKQPDWYQGYSQNRFNSVLFVNSLSHTNSSFAHAATPVSSSTGHSSGFSGGFSGGGGGGGGGGSW